MKMKMLSFAGHLACALLIVAPLAAQRPERPTLAISGYVIDAELDTGDAPSGGQGGGQLYRA